MDSQKAAVLEYFKKDRSLMGARNLYNHFPNRSRALQNSFARMRETEGNLKIVYYELAKHVGITERELTILLNRPVGKQKAEAPAIQKEETKEVETTPMDQLMAFSGESANYYEARSLVAALGLEPPDLKKDTIYAALEGARQAEVQKQISSLPKEVKASIKLRDQFPFLRDPDCPDALKILVNDLITTYEKFRETQPQLHKLLSESDAQHTVDVILENYISNKEAYAELEHYKEKGEILGEHPIFKRLADKQEISEMGTPDLVKKIKSLGINIGKNRKKGNDDLVARDEELLAHAEAVLSKR